MKHKNNKDKKSYTINWPNPFTGLMMDIAREVPNYWNTFCSIDIEMDYVNALRAKCREQETKLTYTPFILKAIAMAIREQLKQVPEFNAAIVYNPFRKVVFYNDIDLSLATEVEVDQKMFFYGPVIRSIDKYSITEIAREIAKASNPLVKDASPLERDLQIMQLPPILRKIALWLGRNIPSYTKQYRGTLFVTGVGQYGVELLPPACRNMQFSMGTIESRAVVRNGKVQARLMMTLTVVFDHRLLYAAPVARLLIKIREYLENLPLNWIEDSINDSYILHNTETLVRQ